MYRTTFKRFLETKHTKQRPILQQYRAQDSLANEGILLKTIELDKD